MDLTDPISTARSTLSGMKCVLFLLVGFSSNRYNFGTEELVIKYALDQHRQDLISILEAPDQELHYAVVVQ